LKIPHLTVSSHRTFYAGYWLSLIVNAAYISFHITQYDPPELSDLNALPITMLHLESFSTSVTPSTLPVLAGVLGQGPPLQSLGVALLRSDMTDNSSNHLNRFPCTAVLLLQTFSEPYELLR
jgi:hypothetical protein